MMIFYLFSCLIGVSTVLGNAAYNYTENLNIVPNFPNNKSNYITFNFNQSYRTPRSPDHAFNDWSHFPRIMGDLLTSFEIRELLVVSSKGKPFRTSTRTTNSHISKSSGVQVRVVIDSLLDAVRTRDLARSLSSDISGMFCFDVSLLTVCDKTVCETHYFDDVGFKSNSHQAVCLENLSPWLKLLPCKKTGLISLIMPRSYFASEAYDYVLKGNRSCDSNYCRFSLLQSLGYVESEEARLDIKNSIYVSRECKLVTNVQKTSWTDEGDVVSKGAVSVNRYITGYGDEFGTLIIALQNFGPDAVVEFEEEYSQHIQLYINTLEIIGNMKIINQTTSTFSERIFPAKVQFFLSIPGNTRALLKLQFRKSLLRYKEYPPDSNRGFDLEPGKVVVYESSGGKYTISLDNAILQLPLVDFSMPYNVITLSCSVLALLFGTIFNNMIRTFKSIPGTTVST